MINKISSGGQSGSDLGGLLAGKYIRLDTGGWAPRFWLQESPDGRSHISAPWLAEYGLKEHPTPTGEIPKTNSKEWVDFYVKAYVYRTEANARDSCGTLWFGGISDSRGFGKTKQSCNKYKKPFLSVDGLKPSEVRKWILDQGILVLNVAGNRESKRPAKYKDRVFSEVVRDFIIKVLN